MTIENEKTYFGGHETFVLRSTWLSKGCQLLANARNGVDFANVDTFDALGIGKNMSKSLAFWLRCTGLCEPIDNQNHLRLSPIGQLVLKKDPYFQQETTVWIMHTYLMAGRYKPEVFKWGFNHRMRGKFNRNTFTEQFKFFVEIHLKQERAEKTLQNDISCFLRSYAFRLSKDVNQDPEDIANCPLQRLKLLAFYPSSMTYEYFSGAKKPPASIIGLYLALRFWNPDIDDSIELRLEQVLHAEGSPGVVLGVKWQNFERALEDLSPEAQCTIKTVPLSDGVGVLLSNHSPLQWLTQCYENQ